MKKVFVILSSCLLLGCVNKSTHQRALQTIDSLRVANQTLIEENDELLNGEKRLIDYIELHNRNNDFLKSYDFIVKLKSKHPESDYITKNEKILSVIENEARIMLDSLEKAKQDSIRRANIHELGIWKIGEYVNDFDEPTGEKYLYANVIGIFSNSATARSILGVKVKVFNDGSIGLYYDEYNDGTYENEKIRNIRIVNKEARKVYESLWDMVGDPDDCLFDNDESSSRESMTLEEVLVKEGEYEFYIILKYNTKYQFTIDSRYLANAMFKAGIKEIWNRPNFD
ncbi:MAG: hypothetical protein J6C45_06040 [Alistipes sp.]|nr:hypothetical protein [Alistipes sp.]